MIVEFRNCFLRIKHIGTEEDFERRDYIYNHRNPKKSLKPIANKHPSRSKSPKKDILKNVDTTSIRYCMKCDKMTLFVHKSGWKHSKCSECQNTHSKRGKLTTKINKCLHPNRYQW